MSVIVDRFIPFKNLSRPLQNALSDPTWVLHLGTHMRTMLFCETRKWNRKWSSGRHPSFVAFLAPSKDDRRQDEELENMEKAVSRIGNVGLTIHGELTSQQQLLNALDEDVDITGSRIKAAQAKIQDILKRSGGNCQMCTIIGLTVVLLILIVVAVAA